MSILEKIKADRLAARKAKETDNVAYLNFLIGEIEKIGKNAGNRETTNDEAITVLKKTLNNVDSTILANAKDVPFDLIHEKHYLESLLPAMVGEDVVKARINSLIKSGGNKGSIMKDLRAEYGATIDMKTAGAFADEALANT